jgi:hypothetical protein
MAQIQNANRHTLLHSDTIHSFKRQSATYLHQEITQSLKQRAMCPLTTLDINSKQQTFSKQQRLHLSLNNLHTKQKMLPSLGSSASVTSNFTAYSYRKITSHICFVEIK